MDVRAPVGQTFLSAFISILSLALPVSAAPPDAEPAWKPLAEKPAAHKELVDCRSPIVSCESRLVGKPWTLDKASLTFERAGKTVRATIRREPASAEAMAGKGAKVETIVLKDLPALLTLDAFGTSYGLSVRLDPDGERVLVGSAFGVKVPVGGRTAFLVDSDLDGVVGSAGDGLVVPGSRTVGPLDPARTEIWTDREAVAVKREADQSWSLSSVACPKPDDPDHSAAWRYFQWQREACGILPVAYHAELEDGMRKHAEYLRINKLMGHGETEGKNGFTREGLDAGETSVLGYDKRSCLAGAREQIATLFHRMMCLAPDLGGSAMVLEKGTFLLSASKFIDSPLRGRALVWPPHGMTDVPCEFSPGGEMPMPVEGSPSPNHLGTPVGIFAMGFYRVESLPEKPVLKLVALDARGNATAVEGSLHYPGHVPSDPAIGKSYRGNVALTPKEFLKPDTRYRASIVVLIPRGRGPGQPGKEDCVPFSYEWEFTTGKRSR